MGDPRPLVEPVVRLGLLVVQWSLDAGVLSSRRLLRRASVAGLWLFRGRCVPRQRWSAAVHVGVSFVAFCGVAWLLPRHLSAQPDGLSRLSLVSAWVVFVWCSVFGFDGLAHHLFDRESSGVAYIAAASCWIYLVHVPVVGAAQISLSGLPGPAFMKFVAVVAVALFVSLFSYEHAVRRTFVGRWLNGTRRIMASLDRPHCPSARTVAQTR